MKVHLRKIGTKLGIGKIDLSKFDKKKLFKTGIVRFLGLSILTIVICIFVLSLIRANQEEKREEKKQEEGTEIKIGGRNRNQNQADKGGDNNGGIMEG